MAVGGAITIVVFVNTPVAWMGGARDLPTDHRSDDAAGHQADRPADDRAHGAVSEALTRTGRGDAGDERDGCGCENGSHGHVLSTAHSVHFLYSRWGSTTDSASHFHPEKILFFLLFGYFWEFRNFLPKPALQIHGVFSVLLKILLSRGLEMYKTILAVAVVALLAGLATFLMFVPDVKAATFPAPPAIEAPAMADHLAGPEMAAATCSQDAWPNYEPRCLFDATHSLGDVRKVRIINLVRRETR
jgi:hypothetical protein